MERATLVVGSPKCRPEVCDTHEVPLATLESRYGLEFEPDRSWAFYLTSLGHLRTVREAPEEGGGPGWFPTPENGLDRVDWSDDSVPVLVAVFAGGTRRGVPLFYSRAWFGPASVNDVLQWVDTRLTASSAPTSVPPRGGYVRWDLCAFAEFVALEPNGVYVKDKCQRHTLEVCTDPVELAKRFEDTAAWLRAFGDRQIVVDQG